MGRTSKRSDPEKPGRAGRDPGSGPGLARAERSVAGNGERSDRRPTPCFSVLRLPRLTPPSPFNLNEHLSEVTPYCARVSEESAQPRVK